MRIVMLLLLACASGCHRTRYDCEACTEGSSATCNRSTSHQLGELPAAPGAMAPVLREGSLRPLAVRVSGVQEFVAVNA
jgi:hypothetical protein